MKIYPLLSLCFLLTFISCKTKKGLYSKTASQQRIAFYNVENLFDLEDNPDKEGDEVFTPEGRNEWTKERYNTKLNMLSKVLNKMGNPVIVGLCEVENEKVVQDLVATSLLKGENYGVVHRESNDHRGIDVALIYKKNNFEVENIENIKINFPKEVVENYTTRDFLIVEGTLNDKTKLHLIVNHWPSRRGGLPASEPKRVYVAEQVRKKVDAILAKDKNANIILMGDFNDEPPNKSCSETLGACLDFKKDCDLYNRMGELDNKKMGTYNYRGTWNMLDQFMVSRAIQDSERLPVVLTQAPYKEEWMLYNSEKYGKTPNRTYGGPNYYGGYSDHLPVFMDILVK